MLARQASGVKMQRVRRCWTAAFTAFTRTKTVDVQHLHNTELKRCLNVVDLIALGPYKYGILRIEINQTSVASKYTFV